MQQKLIQKHGPLRSYNILEIYSTSQAFLANSSWLTPKELVLGLAIELICYLPNLFIGFLKIKVAISTTVLLNKRKGTTFNQNHNWHNRNICKKFFFKHLFSINNNCSFTKMLHTFVYDDLHVFLPQSSSFEFNIFNKQKLYFIFLRKKVQT